MTGTVWLNFGQFHCSIHRQGIPFFNPPDGTKCAECSHDASESYLNRPHEERGTNPDPAAEEV